MVDHLFDPTTRVCVGCARHARDVENEKNPAPCGAVYKEFTTIAEAYTVVVTVDEDLVLLLNGRTLLKLDGGRIFDLRDAIDEGIDELRNRKP